MNAIGIIPARIDATRFPGKPMAKIHGMPMIGHCYFRTKLAFGESSTYVATCDEEIASYIRELGGQVIMTSNSHTRATTRTAEAMELIEDCDKRKIDIVVMIQGDEPLIRPRNITEMLPCFDNLSVDIVNIMSRIQSYDQFVDKNNVKVVVDNNLNALYFSREPIPSPWKGIENILMYMQTGIIAFRRDALLKFNNMVETSLEQIESIDMNRVLENSGSIRMLPIDLITIGVDTPKELKEAEEIMKTDNTMTQYLTI
jgi:3-deoxy-manno-octulosonate cytidylyltransferase (CMP-KDO synthetase)